MAAYSGKWDVGDIVREKMSDNSRRHLLVIDKDHNGFVDLASYEVFVLETGEYQIRTPVIDGVNIFRKIA